MSRWRNGMAPVTAIGCQVYHAPAILRGLRSPFASVAADVAPRPRPNPPRLPARCASAAVGAEVIAPELHSVARRHPRHVRGIKQLSQILGSPPGPCPRMARQPVEVDQTDAPGPLR